MPVGTFDRHVGFPRTRQARVGNIVAGMVTSRGAEMPVLRSYLIEVYVANLDRDAASAITAALDNATDRLANLGTRVEWRAAFAVYAEETYFVVVAACDEDVARRLSEAADLRVDHLVEVALITRGGERERRPAAVPTSRRAGR